MKRLPRLFGTDGIRAPFGEYPLDRATATGLGHQLAQMLTRESAAPWVVLGGDTRFSTPELCAWLAAGLNEGGTRVRFLGAVPTPAIAFVARTRSANAGVAVSASHNPWPDNGIKLIGGDGFKWTTDRESELEHRLADGGRELPAPALEPEPALVEPYAEWLRTTVPASRPLAGLRIAIDAANGAAAPFAAPLFKDLGAEVLQLFAEPNCRNINL
ncbi:MAG: phosphoglucosamine mutase, partial [Acidobacteria bacterium]|nr:phosphoglucosamine mutase [Acidobacteriota bacterium]